jgi:hypothetical protein
MDDSLVAENTGAPLGLIANECHTMVVSSD